MRLKRLVADLTLDKSQARDASALRMRIREIAQARWRFGAHR